jgi:SAM-dependent methyltransferase
VSGLKKINGERQFPSRSLDEIHYRVIRLMESYPRGRALDLPAGTGRLSWWLYQRDFDVTAGDIDTDQFRNPEIPVFKMDLNGILPLEDDSFDYAFCIEGPEHVENMYQTFREFARVLKHGGRLIVSYPNYSNLESRLRNIFYGILEPVEPPGATEIEGKPHPGHINRPPYGLLRMAMEYAGFRVEKITREKFKWNQFFLFPLFMMIRLFTIVKGDRGDAKYWLRESNSYDVLMGGNSLIIVALLNKQKPRSH